MYEKMYQQAESLLKPFGDIMSLNFEVMDAIREKQADFLSGMLLDSIEHVKDLSGQTSLELICEVQKKYWESVQEKVSANTQDSYTLLSDSQEKLGEVIQGVVSWPEMPSWSDIISPDAVKAPAKKSASPRKSAAKKKSPASKAVAPASSDVESKPAEAVGE